MDRRALLIGSAAFGLLAACGPKGPGSVTIVAQGAAGMNLATDGQDRPVILQVIQMRGTGAFDSADYFALQDPAKALGGDFVIVDQIAVAPGATAQKTITLDGATVAIAVIAGFLQPGNKAFRAKFPVSGAGTATFVVDLGPNGMSVAPK